MSNNNIDLVSLVNQALCLWKDSDFINCRELCIKALNIVRQLDPSTPKMMISHAELLKCLGNLEHQQGNYTESLDYYSQALTISKKLNAKDLVAKITNNIATIYYLLEDYKKAISFY